MPEFEGIGWELISDAVEQLSLERVEGSYHRFGGVGISARIPPGGRALVKRAAHGRGLGMNAYAGRAVMAFVCADLGVDWWDVMADEYPIVELGDAPNARHWYAGSGFGDWRVQQ